MGLRSFAIFSTHYYVKTVVCVCFFWLNVFDAALFQSKHTAHAMLMCSLPKGFPRMILSCPLLAGRFVDSVFLRTGWASFVLAIESSRKWQLQIASDLSLAGSSGHIRQLFTASDYVELADSPASVLYCTAGDVQSGAFAVLMASSSWIVS